MHTRRGRHASSNFYILVLFIYAYFELYKIIIQNQTISGQKYVSLILVTSILFQILYLITIIEEVQISSLKMIKNYLPCSQQTLYQQVHINQPSSLDNIEKSSEIYDLPHYQINKECKDRKQEKNVINLAVINKQNRLEVNDQALNIIAQNSKSQIIFCGVYGAKRSGKSTFVDNMLKISDSEHGFVFEGKYHREKSLKMNKYPLQVSQSKMIFFIEYSNSFETSQLEENELKLLDLLIMISNTMIVIVNKQDSLKIITRHISNSAKRLKFHLKFINYWPESLYIINTHNSLSNDIGSIDYFFRRISTLLWTIGQGKTVKNIIADIGELRDNKSYKFVSNNSLILYKLILKLEYEENKTKIDQQINIQNLFEELYQQLLEQYLKFMFDLYDSSLQSYFKEEKSYSIDYIINSFQQCKDIAFQQFKLNHINKDYSQQQLQKLEDYIQQRERLVIEVNKKKTIFAIKLELANIIIGKKTNFQQLFEYKERIKQISLKYNHGTSEQVGSKIVEMYQRTQRIIRKQKKKDQEQFKKQIEELEQQLKKRKSELNCLINKNEIKDAENKQKQYKKGLSKIQHLSKAMISIQRQIQLQKKTQRSYLVNKQNHQEKTQKMLELVRSLQEKKRENGKILKDIEAEYDFNPDIERIQRRLQDLDRQGSKMQKSYNSMISQVSKLESKVQQPSKKPS